jgi:pyruvate/2-oxoacid:ferredoxin oxidoreductase beta subunit
MVDNCAMPFCKGCGHSHVLRKLNDALTKLHIPPSKVNLVTDIGCIGLADVLFETPHTVHTTHGRSTAFATGIELADSVLSDSKLKTIVLIGDGGAMIGLLHLVNAALLNVDVTVLLCNNFLFGMTGGQHSAFSPIEFITPTTPDGNIIPPIDMCRVMLDARAEFVARKLATDKDLGDVLAEAIQHPGFSLVEIVELCTEHATTKNELTGNAIRSVIEEQGQEFGILSSEKNRAEFGVVYGDKNPRDRAFAASVKEDGFVPQFESKLKHQVGIVIAGSAGERVQSAAKKLCEAAVLSNLHCTQKNDNPVTQGSGFSLAEVILSPHEIYYTGIETPDAVIVVSEDGLNELYEKHLFDRLKPATMLLIDSSLPKPHSDANIVEHPFRKEFGGAKAAVKAIEFYIQQSDVLPMEVFQVS